jgi:hypothetical protein
MRAALASLVALAAIAPTARADEPHVACAHRDPLRQPFFGDLHVHTRWSLDASTQGTRTTPADAYRFARGEPVGLGPWEPSGRALRSARLERPLDFAAVTDHSELFGEVALCSTPGAPGHVSFMCRVYRGWPRVAFFYMNGRGSPRFRFCGQDGAACLDAARGAWAEMRAAAEQAYDRTGACAFTAFVGYEWTGQVPPANNLHRNVVFRSASVPELPASAIEHPTAEALWDALDVQCRRALPGCEALVIPHNSNLSGGYMFGPLDSSGAPLDAAAARRRAANERLVEIMPHQGDSECLPAERAAPFRALGGAGTEDEACAFEKLPYDSFMGRFARFQRSAPAAHNFVRTALGLGLELGARLGANPFELGVIASTDTHLGTPGLVAERGYPGHGGAGIPIGDALPEGLLDLIEYNPGGLAAVWAEENTREAIFAALARREVYGTSGPRIALRVFAGWSYPDDLCATADFAARGYAEGVPMGGALPRAPDPGSAPVIALRAARDPGTLSDPGARLERLQVVKLWLDAGGAVHERVVDVATTEAGADLDTGTCQPAGGGADQLCAVWRDRDFDPARPALYYARVLERPTCRWSAWACNAARVDCADPRSIGRGYEPCCDPDYPRATQERAWSSAIWYRP